MSIELMKREMTTLNPQKAEQFLRFNTFKLQRQERPTHTTELIQKMESGLFRFGEVAIAHNGSGDEFMMNGQHVCRAVITANVTVPCVVEHFHCPEPEDISDLFRQFEILPRSLADMVKVEAAQLGLTWPNWVSSIVVSAASLGARSSPRLSAPTSSGSARKGGLTKEQKVHLLKPHLKEGTFVNDIMTNINGEYMMRAKVSQHLGRAPVVLVMMQSFKKHQDNAKQFWCRVRDGENLNKKMPEFKLREFLLRVNSLVGGKARYYYRKADNHEFACRCIVAWNASRKNTPTTLKYFATKPVPRVL
jgi:hypothetical protein